MRVVTKLPKQFLPAIKDACTAHTWSFGRVHFSLDDEHKADIDAGEAYIKLDKADKALLNAEAAAGLMTKLLFLAEKKYRNAHTGVHAFDRISAARHAVRAGKGEALFHYHWSRLLDNSASEDRNIDTLKEFLEASAGWLAFHGHDEKKSAMLRDLARKMRGYRSQEEKWRNLVDVLKKDLDNPDVAKAATEIYYSATGHKEGMKVNV